MTGSDLKDVVNDFTLITDLIIKIHLMYVLNKEYFFKKQMKF